MRGSIIQRAVLFAAMACSTAFPIGAYASAGTSGAPAYSARNTRSNAPQSSSQPTQRTTMKPKGSIDLAIDATEAPRNILHGVEKLTATPGDMTLLYPEWIPGEHAPTGPVTDFVGLHIFADGKEVPWTRDSVNMYAFHVPVPNGAKSLEVKFDQLLPVNTPGFSSGSSSTANLLMLSWNQVVVYPGNVQSDDVQVTAHVKMPEGWKFGTALPRASEAGQQLDFQTVSLTTLVDSPVLMGAHFRSIPLGVDMGRPHFFDMAADSDAALQLSNDEINELKQLVKETGALYGARHYREYHFLVTVSDATAHFGLEHHQSSDDRVGERSFIDDTLTYRQNGLYPHEFTHSWNGKYRRPAGLATGNYHDPMKGDLLWVYEGLTEYLGEILTARSGLWTPEQFREEAASDAASLDTTAGRTWRPLQDTATAAQLLYPAPRNWENWRRSVDYYPEGFLIWMEVDTIIRRESHGARSIDDFCHKFHGGGTGAPEVVPYTFDDVVNTLNSVQPYDWRTFLTDRLTSKSPHAPLGGLENAGWKLAYTDKEPQLTADTEADRHVTDVRYSVGLFLDEKGNVADLLIGSPAEKAGIAPGMSIVAVNGRRYDEKILHDAIKAKGPLELIMANGDFFKTYSIDYHGGERYPVLERDTSKPDLLSQIIASKAGAPPPKETPNKAKR